MFVNIYRFKVLLPVLAILMLAGCNGSSSNSATLSLAVADTPVDSASSVNIVFTGVQIHGSGSTATEYDFKTPMQIDLMQQQGGNSATLLSNVSLPAGNYQWIRLLVDISQSTITLKDGTVHPLTLPSGSQTGLKLVSGFTVATGDVIDFTIDFNLRSAITLAGATGTYILKPALRLMNNVNVGTISGTVSNSFMIGNTSVSDANCSPAVYFYSGANVTPTDINPTSTVQPITTASLTLNSTTGDYDYHEGFMATGDYTLAVTCAAKDDPTLVDNLVFSAAKNATVTAKQTTTVNFP